MKKGINRSVPDWPKIRKDGVTAAGFGDVDGNQSCLCTKHNSCSIYLPRKLIRNIPLKVARTIFEQTIPVIDNIWDSPGDRSATVRVDSATWELYLKFYFSHILICRA